jgi:hypothetical protein
MNGHTADIISRVLESTYPEHNLIVYSNIEEFSEIYSNYASKKLENEIVVIATHYETLARVRDNIASKGVNVDKYEKAGSLKIIDAVKGYQSGDVYGVAKLAKSMVKHALSGNKTGVTEFGDVGSFFLLERTVELMNYEMSLPQKFDLQLKAFCCYHVNDFDILSEGQKKQLLGAHSRAILPT